MSQKLENLLLEQKTDVDELNRVIRNYKSDGSSRKNERYLRDKQRSFTDLFKRICEKDGIIQSEVAITPDPSQPYFTEDTFNAISKLYSEIMEDITKRQLVFKAALNIDNAGAGNNLPTNPQTNTPPADNRSNNLTDNLELTPKVSDGTGNNGVTNLEPKQLHLGLVITWMANITILLIRVRVRILKS